MEVVVDATLCRNRIEKEIGNVLTGSDKSGWNGPGEAGNEGSWDVWGGNHVYARECSVPRATKKYL